MIVSSAEAVPARPPTEKVYNVVSVGVRVIFPLKFCAPRLGDNCAVDAYPSVVQFNCTD